MPVPRGRGAENRSAVRAITAFGRLADDATPETAGTDFANLAMLFARDYPDTYPKEGGYQISVAPLQNELTKAARPTLLILLATAGLVLLIACANVANLAVARLMRRDR